MIRFFYIFLYICYLFYFIGVFPNQVKIKLTSKVIVYMLFFSFLKLIYLLILLWSQFKSNYGYCFSWSCLDKSLFLFVIKIIYRCNFLSRVINFRFMSNKLKCPLCIQIYNCCFMINLNSKIQITSSFFLLKSQ